MEMLRQYQAGALPPDLRHQVERHLLSCELCSDMVEGMAIARPARVRLAVRETHGRLKHLLAQKKRKRKVFQWPIWQTAAVLLVLAFAIAEVIYHHYFAQPSGHFTQNTQPAANSSQLTGVVTDAAGQKLEGATVQVEESSSRVTTGPGGQFTLDLPAEGATLVITSPGFQPKKITVTPGNKSVNIILDKKE
ncbi:hypothetical protein TH63_04665 [Rufibacter radiotolerans]|uniref:Putative zinc-finger domain-containing protein n=2 Tax=Rufibacter radiotolerans TaxID=1379910 RepID=A0A0H4VMI4_9BACT|nr:hypothetical protein TH63_04665 [Rufibacter radiotolerans]